MARPGLMRHRKFARLARLLGSKMLARGALELLWDVAYENGDDLLGDAQDVEFLAEWEGEAGKLASALVDSGFLDSRECGLAVHDLFDHAPDYVRKRRTREAERRTKGDKLRSAPGQRPVTDQSLTGQCPPNGRTRAPAPAPAPAHTQEAETSVAVAPAPAAVVEDQDQDKPRSKARTEKPTASRHAATVGLLVEAWKASVGTAYPFQGGRDGAAVSKLLAYSDATDEEIRRRFAVYLGDAFNVKQASLAHFVSKWAGCVEAPAARRSRDPRFGSARAEDQHHPAAPGPMWFPGDPAPKPEGMP